MKQLLILLISILFCSCALTKPIHKDVYYWHDGKYNFTDRPDTLKGKHYYKTFVSYTYKN